MNTYKSGFKVSIPLIYCPGGSFNGQLAITTDMEFATITILKAKEAPTNGIAIEWHGKENTIIQDSLEKYNNLLVQLGLIPKGDYSLKLRWGTNNDCDFLPTKLKCFSLDVLSLFALLHVHGIESVIQEDLYTLFPSSPDIYNSVFICAFLGGGIWYGGYRIHDRLFLPAGLSVALFDHLNEEEVLAKNRKPGKEYLPSFLINLNRANLDRCIEIGHVLCGIQPDKVADGTLLLNRLEHGQAFGALFLNNNQAASFIQHTKHIHSSNVLATISNEGLKKH